MQNIQGGKFLTVHDVLYLVGWLEGQEIFDELQKHVSQWVHYKGFAIAKSGSSDKKVFLDGALLVQNYSLNGPMLVKDEDFESFTAYASEYLMCKEDLTLFENPNQSTNVLVIPEEPPWLRPGEDTTLFLQDEVLDKAGEFGIELKKPAQTESVSEYLDYETPILRAQRLAVDEFWKDYDANKPPSNYVVSLWLQENHGISENIAKGIATIIRPDNLKTKKKG